MRNTISKIIQYGLYPLLLSLTILTFLGAINHSWDYKVTYGLATLGTVLILITTETLFPLSGQWKMTKKSFFRDLSYIAFNLPTIVLSKSAFGILAIWYSENHSGFFSNSSIILSTISYLLVFEFFQYWYHRISHTGKGKLGKFLWRVHLAHHLPDKVYVVMHAVFNPINALITVIIIQTPIILLGISPEAVLAASLMIDLQSLVSHFNVDLRLGFLNYIFIGTETHRYHHSANHNEAKNYGNTLAIWDLVFGTFEYKPGIVPKKLGVENPQNYPDSDKTIRVILFPFTKTKNIH